MNNDLTNQLIDLRANPTLMHRRSLENCQAALGGGVDFFNANSPFVLATENTATHFSAFMKQSESLVRRMYPSLAVTEEDLYYHMTEKDFDNRFALPATNPEYIIVFNLDELKSLGVKDEKTGAIKVIIPWSTVLMAGQINYGFFYDLSIIILRNGGVRCSWEGDITNGIMPLSTNVVEHDVYSGAGSEVKLLRLFLPVYQYTLTSKFLNLNASGGNKAKYMLTESYYTCRVWNQNPLSGKLESVPTTHSAQSYDGEVLTAVLKVADGVLTVDIPDIYANNPRLGSQLRIDIYTCLGSYSKNLADQSTDMYSINWRDLDKKNTQYTAVLGKLSMISSASTQWTNGGRNALTVSELRERIKYRGNNRPIPITPTDQTIYLEDRDMKITPIIDNFSDRVQLTTKRLTAANTEYSESALGMMVYPTTINTSMLDGVSTVVHNNERVTILPETLYRNASGVVSMVSDTDRLYLESLEPTELISTLNGTDFIYSPYHYVLDSSSDFVTFGAYYLDKPSLLGRVFVDDNPTVPYVLTPKDYSFSKVENGYRLYVTVTKDEALADFKPFEVFVQIAFVPDGERRRVYLTGTYAGVTGESQDPVFQFDIDTSYIINRNHALSLNGFKANVDDKQPHFTSLIKDFDIFIGLYDYKLRFLVLDPSFSELDQIVCEELLTSDEALVLSHNQVSLRFGDALPELYSECRNAKSEAVPELWNYDVMDYYDETVLKQDPKTGMAEIVITGDGVEFITLHEKGDPVMEGGTHKVLYPAGSAKRDQDGNVIIAKDSNIVQYVNMLFVDARFRFVDEESLIAYRDSAITEVIGWVINDVREISPQLLGRTELFLAPTRTMGTLTVDHGAGLTLVDARQPMAIDVWVSNDTYANMLLRGSISKSIRTIIAKAISERTVIISNIQTSIKDALGGDITGCMVYGLGANKDLVTFTVVDEDATLSLANSMSMRSDGKLIVSDNLEINFIKSGF